MTGKEIANEILHYPQTEGTITGMIEDFARQEAIEFAEWCYKKEYRYDIRGWWHTNHTAEKFSTQELYDKWRAER